MLGRGTIGWSIGSRVIGTFGPKCTKCRRWRGFATWWLAGVWGACHPDTNSLFPRGGGDPGWGGAGSDRPPDDPCACGTCTTERSPSRENKEGSFQDAGAMALTSSVLRGNLFAGSCQLGPGLRRGGVGRWAGAVSVHHVFELSVVRIFGLMSHGPWAMGQAPCPHPPIAKAMGPSLSPEGEGK
jgi:hypothetical protein